MAYSKIPPTVLVLLLFAMPALGRELVVEMHRLTPQGTGESLGTVTFSPSSFGVLLTPDLQGLKPGIHGFHVHENPTCEPAPKDGKITPGAAAGGHFDPDNTGTHAGPYQEGHLGDLPALCVEPDGTATLPILAPRLQVSDLVGRAVIVHEGGDNYSDQPPLGGGGSRVACGVVPDKK